MNSPSSRFWRKRGEAFQQRRMEGVGSSSPGSSPFPEQTNLKDFKTHPKRYSVPSIFFPNPAVGLQKTQKGNIATNKLRIINCKNATEYVFLLEL